MTTGSGRSAPGARARALAAMAVDNVLAQGRTLDQAFATVVSEPLPAREQSQIKALAFGALRWHDRHRLIITQLLERPLRRRDKVLESLLSVGLYELIEARQPAYAIVSATVDASRELKRQRAAGLINAALRRFQRESNELLSITLGDEQGRYNHPQWLIDCVRADWPDVWQQVLTAALMQPPMWLRINSARTTKADWAQRLRNETDVASESAAEFPDALLLAEALPVASLPGFADGDATVQDAAAQLSADLLAPEVGMRVLDACAAPGGKSTHLLERTNGELGLVAVDIDSTRCGLLTDNLRRVGYSADVITADVQDVDAWSNGRRFDRILIDAPCSATGVIRRHPDIKFLRRVTDIKALAERQLAMLNALWPLLDPGGRLLYATCSVLRRENDDVVARFLALHADAREIRPLSGEVLMMLTEFDGPGYQFLPGPANTDGFYYALIERAA